MNHQDFHFIQKRTKLSKDKLSSLLSNPRDFDLILNSISKLKEKRPIKLIQELNELSPETQLKYLLYKFNTVEVDVSIVTYLAECILENYALIFDKGFNPRVPNKLTEKNGRYYLIGGSIFRDVLAKENADYKKYIDYAQKCFEQFGPRELARNTHKWSNFLYEFDRSKDDFEKHTKNTNNSS